MCPSNPLQPALSRFRRGGRRSAAGRIDAVPDPSPPESRAGTPAQPGPDGRPRCPWALSQPDLRDYHDQEWGDPVHGETALFERISLEAFQSGLSWLTILRRREGFRAAFDGFDPEAVAAYDEDRAAALLADTRIIRNRAKVHATIGNARAVLVLRERGGLDELVWSHRPEVSPAPRVVEDVPTTSTASRELARDLKRHGLTFVGPTTAHALMEACGLVDTHLLGCFRRGSAS
ncbi:DNA-3-methyladenine glycosylase I [Nocardioidaceae bacterium]|nr:DNA-3-methyladenine glycosylase I [Nocardioidaceae bacterium]